MCVNWRVALLALAAAGVIGLPDSASAQFGYPGGGYPGGYGGYPGGYGGYGGGLGGLNNQQQLQQLPPQNLRNNWYMYDSIGGMGRTGGTVQIVTQFGLQSQQQNTNGINNAIGGYGGGGYGGYPGYFGVNYQRRLMQAQLAAAYQANAYRQMNQMYAPITPPANSTASYGSYAPASTPQFGGFGFANSSVRTGFGAFTPQGFEPKKEEGKVQDLEKNKEKDGKDKK